MSNIFLWLDSEAMVGYPFSDMKVAFGTYVYFLFEKLIIVMLAVVILENNYKIAGYVFLGIAVLDTLDYVLFYGEPWAPISWNVIKVGIFGLTIAFEYVRNSR